MKRSLFFSSPPFLLILFIIFGILLNGCSESYSDSPKVMAKAIIGHWLSEDGKNHFYFSKEGSMVGIFNGNKWFDDVYRIYALEGPHKKSKIILVIFRGRHEESFLISFDSSRKKIVIERLAPHPTKYGIFKYLDEKEKP